MLRISWARACGGVRGQTDVPRLGIDWMSRTPEGRHGPTFYSSGASSENEVRVVFTVEKLMTLEDGFGFAAGAGVCFTVLANQSSARF
jgi:hypothetical protein